MNTTRPQHTYANVKDAARTLGVTENAVRMRIKRGTLVAEKVGDQWLVQLPTSQHHSDHHTSTDHDTDQSTPRPTDQSTPHPEVTLDAIESAITRTSERYMADFEVVHGRLDALYRDWLEDKDRLIDELRRRAEVAESRLRDFEAQNVESPTAEASAPQNERERPWWRFW